MFENAVLSEQTMSGETAFLYTYGTYLAGGGRPGDFEELTMTDIQIMYTVFEGTRRKNIAEQTKNLVKVLKALFGQQED